MAKGQREAVSGQRDLLASQGGSAVVGGQTYNFSFWAYQASSGASLVQNYKVNWLNGSGTGVGDTG